MPHIDPATVASRSPSLPYDLLHSHIIPDILSEHLHLLLVAPVAPECHPFFTLPLVSYQFRQTVRSLCITIFGLEKEEDPSVIGEILAFAQSLWSQAKRPPEMSRPVLEYTCQQLMTGGSLIRIYMCIALARSFLNYDVLRYIIPAERNWEFAALEQGFMGVDVCDDYRAGNKPRMPDQKMHRLFLPITCAMKLCDLILPQRLAFTVAEYLADIVPVLSTAPVILKYSQDLESYIAREHRIEGVSAQVRQPSTSCPEFIVWKETWVTWMHQTLGLIEDTELLVKQMQETGRLVHSFPRCSSIPWGVLQATNIIQVLRDVSITDWGVYSEAIQMRAISLLKGFGYTI